MDELGELEQLEVARLAGRLVDGLVEQGLSVRLRKMPERGSSQSSPLEIDLAVGASHLDALADALEDRGWSAWAAPGRGGHRFFLRMLEGRWIKVDVVAEPRPPGHPLIDALRRRLPAGIVRRGAVIALVGPDGAGKSTVLAALHASLPVASEVVYLGGRGRWRDPPGGPRAAATSGASARPAAAAANGGPAAATVAPSAAPVGPSPGTWRHRLEALLVLRLLLRRMRRLGRVYGAAWQGRIVLCDRHPLEALAIRPRATRLAASLESWLVGRVLPWPDAVVVLDAPTAVLSARKQEHPPQRLERWRRSYRTVLGARGAHIVSTDRGTDETIADVSAIVWAAAARRQRCRGYPAASPPASRPDGVAASSGVPG